MWNIELLGVQNGLDWEGKLELAIFVLKFPYGWLFPYDLIMLIYNFRIEISIRMVIVSPVRMYVRGILWFSRRYAASAAASASADISSFTIT